MISDIVGSQRKFWTNHTRLALILLFAFGLRLFWMLTHMAVISVDGSEYVRMAMNLKESHRLLSSWGSPETMYAPFYAVLMALTSALGISVELAGHCIALLSGVALVFVLYMLVFYVYGQPAANFSAILAAVHPLFVSLSASIYSETVYLTLWITAIYFGIRALDSFRSIWFVLTGFFIGLAYLTRPEAFAYSFFFALAAWTVAVFRRRSFFRATCGAFLVMGAYFLVALPYVVFLHHHTGQYRLEGKWNINYTIGNRLNEGMPDHKAEYEVGDDLCVRGPLLDPFRFAAFTPYPHGFQDKVHYFLSRARSNFMELYSALSQPAFGSPFLLLLMALGIFGAPWDRDRWSREFVLLTMALSIVVLLASAHHIEPRYSYPFVPLATIWAGNGMETFVSWLRKSSLKLKVVGLDEQNRIAIGGVVLMYALVLLSSYAGTDRRIGFSGDDVVGRSVKEAGLWLEEHGGASARICAMNSRLPYYAHGTLVQFPYADSSITLRYLDSQKVDYIALESGYMRTMPTLGEWFKNGIPDQRAQLVFDTGHTWNEEVKIYRLNRPEVSADGTVGLSQK